MIVSCFSDPNLLTVTVRKLGSEKQEVIKREDLIKNMLAANKLPLN